MEDDALPDDSEAAERESLIRTWLIARRSPMRRLRDWLIRRRIRKREKKAFENVAELPTFARGDQANDRAWELFEQGMTYEAWLTSGRAHHPELREWPPEYIAMMLYGPDALDFYRFYLYETLERALGLSPWNMALRATLARARVHDENGFLSFDQKAWEAIEELTIQRGNALRRYLTFLDRFDGGDKRQALEDLLSTYGLLYEIEYALWFVGVTGSALARRRFRPADFGGPRTVTPKAALISEVARSLEHTPLQPLFKQSYDPALRNAIQHNSFEIKGADDRWVVRDLGTGKTWLAQDVGDLVNNSMQLVEAVATTVSYMHLVDIPRREREFSDRGVVSMGYFLGSDGVPEIIMLQLWCFRDIDPGGDWLSKASGGVRAEPEGLERVHLTDHAFLIGRPVTDTPWATAVRETGFVRVQRLAVCPLITLRYPIYVRPDGRQYEILGLPDEHLVPFEAPHG